MTKTKRSRGMILAIAIAAPLAWQPALIAQAQTQIAAENAPIDQSVSQEKSSFVSRPALSILGSSFSFVLTLKTAGNMPVVGKAVEILVTKNLNTTAHYMRTTDANGQASVTIQSDEVGDYIANTVADTARFIASAVITSNGSTQTQVPPMQIPVVAATTTVTPSPITPPLTTPTIATTTTLIDQPATAPIAPTATQQQPPAHNEAPSTAADQTSVETPAVATEPTTPTAAPIPVIQYADGRFVWNSNIFILTYTNAATHQSLRMWDPAWAFNALRNMATPVSDATLKLIPQQAKEKRLNLATRKKYAGSLIISKTDRSKVWYVHPETLARTWFDGSDASYAYLKTIADQK